ncbi:hypothetical protein [Poseidonibacter lekithochrous]|nr:hypothetical protein [Poseidonibacter lekithochrous]
MNIHFNQNQEKAFYAFNEIIVAIKNIVIGGFTKEQREKKLEK